MPREVTIKISAEDNFSTVLTRYQTAMRDAGTATDDAKTKTSGLAKAWDDWLGKLSVGGIAVAGVALYNFGLQANATEAVFTNLIGGSDKAKVAMDGMRTATQGMIDDMTLQQNASRLLQMNIASTGTELARFTEIATTLGRSMGVDAPQAMENFALLMANQSYLRLDTYGISATNVRMRVKELKEEIEGIDTSEAFKMAVLEEGAKAMDRLGSAAEAAVNPLVKARTAVENLKQDIGQGLVNTINTAGDSLAMLLAIPGLDRELNQVKTAEAQDWINKNMDMLEEYSSMAFGGENPDGFDRNALADIYGTMRFEQLRNGLSPEEAFTKTVGPTDPLALDRMNEYLSVYNSVVRNSEAEAEAAADNALNRERVANAVREQAAYESQLLRGYEGLRAQREKTGIFTGMDTAAQRAAGLMTTTGYMRPEDAAQVRSAATEMTDYMDRLEELQALELVSEDEVNRAQEMADRVGDMATEADKAAAAFENLTLSEAFGQKGGGLMGEIGDRLLATLQEQQGEGADPGKADQLKRQLDLASGRETQLSVAFQDQIEPLLASVATQLGDQAALQAVQNLTTYIQNAKVQGLTEQQMAVGLPGAAGFMQAPAGPVFQVPEWYTQLTSGQGIVSFMQQQGGVLGGIGDVWGGLTGKGAKDKGKTGAEKAVDNIADSASRAVSQVDAIVSSLDSIPAEKTVKINIDAPNLAMLQSLIGGQITATVANNGGTVPGTTGAPGTGSAGRTSTGTLGRGGRNRPID